MLSEMTGLIWPFSWFERIYNWFCTPVIFPFAGIIASIVAALTIDSKNWLISFKRLRDRTLRVAIVWLFIVVLIANLTQLISGKGRSRVLTESNVPKFPVPVIRETNKSKVVTIRFVKSSETGLAQDFACDLDFSSSKNSPRMHKIRAKDKNDFLKQLISEIDKYHKNQSEIDENSRLKIILEKNPSPGQSVIRSINMALKSHFDKIDILSGVGQ